MTISVLGPRFPRVSRAWNATVVKPRWKPAVSGTTKQYCRVECGSWKSGSPLRPNVHESDGPVAT